MTVALRIAGAPTHHVASLDRLRGQIAAEPDGVEPRFAYAVALEDVGRMAAAHREYVAVLDRDPAHLGALTNLGSLLHMAGVREGARAFYTKAVVEHPQDATARINFANALVEDGELDAARFHYEAALALVPNHPQAHFAFAALLRRLGDVDAADDHHRRAFARPWIRTEPYHGTAPPLRVLLLLAAGGGNVVTTLLLDDRVMQTTTLFVEGDRPEHVLPPHDLVFNAVGDVDRAGEALAAARAIVGRTTAPVLNAPATVQATGRVAVATRLRGLANVVAPRTDLIPRAALDAAELGRRGFVFPLLLRSPGFHTGRHFELVACAEDLPVAVAGLPGEALLAIEYLDLRDAAGDVRKYRVICVGDELFPLHVAIARQWKVHYFSADMRTRPDHRAEEAAFLRDGLTRLGTNVADALAAMRATLGLDYGGIDFGIDAAGNVVLFEANATMAIGLPDDAPENAGRRAAVDGIIAAFGRLCDRRSGRPPR